MKKNYFFHQFVKHIVPDNLSMYHEYVQGYLDFIALSFADRALILPKNFVLWRAQVAYEIRDDTGELVPCGQARMTPDSTKVSNGRANRENSAVFYLATDKETAAHEVRPWPGSYVTTCVYKVIDEKKIIDLTRFHGERDKGPLLLLQKNKPTETQIQEREWTHIDNEFSKPVPNNTDVKSYASTQVISEFIKDAGFDGIVYKSLYTSGYNIVLFDIKAASWQPNSSELREATNVQIFFEPI